MPATRDRGAVMGNTMLSARRMSGLLPILCKLMRKGSYVPANRTNIRFFIVFFYEFLANSSAANIIQTNFLQTATQFRCAKRTYLNKLNQKKGGTIIFVSYGKKVTQKYQKIGIFHLEYSIDMLFIFSTLF